MEKSPRIKIVVIEDSPVMLSALVDLYEGDPELSVVATATSGTEGISKVHEHKPDVVSVDIQLPDIDGFEVIQQIMADHPTPILVLTSLLDPGWRKEALHALSLGAIEVLAKPTQEEFLDQAWRGQIHRQLKIISKATVIPHLLGRVRTRRGSGKVDLLSAPPANAYNPDQRSEVMAVVGSAGGPKALLILLEKLRPSLPLPVPLVMALHQGPGTRSTLPELMSEILGFHVCEAANGQSLEAGCMYMAPGQHHVEVTPGREIRLIDDIGSSNYVPNLDRFLSSVARAYGPAAFGVILSGMGKDGTLGLRDIRTGGGLTLGQDEQSSVVYGMPRTAFELGAVMRQLSPDGIAQFTVEHLSGRAVGHT